MSKVKLEKLNAYFDKLHVLKDIDLEIKQGEFVSILGASGSGKTTLLNTVAGIGLVSSGDILFDDISVVNTSMNKRNAIVVFQDYVLFPHMTVFDNIAYGLKVRKSSKKEIYSKVCEMVKVIGLEDKIYSYPNELSGGQKQRVAIARALIVKPNVLLLDEPFSGLDTTTKNIMSEFVLEMTKKYDITTIMVTHNKEEAFFMSDQVAIMIDGEIKQFDNPANIYNYPNSLEVCKYLSSFNIINEIHANTLNLENNSKFTAINYNDIKLNKLGKYKIIEKKFIGDKTFYVVNINGVELSVYSTDNNYEIGSCVGYEITKYCCFNE